MSPPLDRTVGSAEFPREVDEEIDRRAVGQAQAKVGEWQPILDAVQVLVARFAGGFSQTSQSDAGRNTRLCASRVAR